MDSGAWIEIKQIFAEALACPPADRAALLETRCRSSDFIRAEVEALLEAHTDATGFLEQPAIASASWLVDSQSASLDDRRIGPFRLVASIGQGGMGVVYRAERVEGGFDQQVAIKIIDLALHDADALSRFGIERQILASLNHPNIVQFVDGGQTAEGQAFIVMELIDGVRVTEFCRARALSLDDRLKLVEQICGAVQYAHQHGVVHRDLKPGNILVSADGVVKVLDFGVAKLIASGNESDATRTGMLRPLTPDYASPEQLRGLPVTTASDIYALGVVLYEIVTGRKPYETSRETLDRILEIVTVTEPVRPSQALAREHAGTPYDDTRVRGDLDAIILKAMHKDPTQRYASAQELATDLAHYRASEPVIAREPSLGYLFRKAMRRHRAAAAAVAVSVIAVLGALGVSLWQTQRVAAERDRAQARFNDTRQIANALIFKIHDEMYKLAGSTPARKMIVAEALTYLERLSQDPAVDDALRVELAGGYRKIGAVQGGLGEANLGDRAGARASYERALKLLEPLASRAGAAVRDVVLLSSLELELSAIYDSVPDRPAALASLRSATGRLERLVLEHPTSPEARNGLAAAAMRLGFLSPRPEALEPFQKSLTLFESLLQEKPDDLVRQRNVALGSKYVGARFEERNELDKARAHFMRAMELDSARLAAEPLNRNAMFDVAIDLGNVANIDWKAKRLVEAADGFERSLALRQKLAALDPQDVEARSRVAFMHVRLSYFYSTAKRLPDAIAQAGKAVAIAESLASTAADYRDELVNALIALGEAETLTGDRAGSCRSSKRAHSVLEQMLRANPAAPETQKKQFASLDEAIKKCSPHAS